MRTVAAAAAAAVARVPALSPRFLAMLSSVSPLRSVYGRTDTLNEAATRTLVRLLLAGEACARERTSCELQQSRDAFAAFSLPARAHTALLA